MSDKQTEGIKLYNEYLSASKSRRHKVAKEKLRKSARLGEVMAKHALAYLSEGGGSVNNKNALRLYREAAEGGFAPSAWNLARHYERNGSKAAYFKWLLRAAELGDDEANDETNCPAPYLYRNGLRQIRKGAFAEGLAAIRLAAKWGNLEAARKLEHLKAGSGRK